MVYQQFMGTERLSQILWSQKWPSTAHRDRGGPGITHRDRDSPDITQEVALANLTKIQVVLEELMGTELASILLTGTEWPWQTF